MWTIAGAVGVSALIAAAPLRGAAPAGYYLVWADEFGGTNLDRSKWDDRGLGPRRDAINVTDAVSVSNGYLWIASWTTNGTHYTGMISTDDKLLEKYGYWEARIDFNDNSGLWSAFWLQSPTMGSPVGDVPHAGAEIDICEHRRYDGSQNNIDGRIVSNIHWDGYGDDHRSVGSGLTSDWDLNLGFHTYGLEWTPTRYYFNVDGTAFYNTSSGLSKRTEYALLSSEIEDLGWAGDIPAGGYGNKLTTTNRLMVDYVRYYAPTSMVFWDGGAATGTWAAASNWVANRAVGYDVDVVFSGLATARYSHVLGRDFTVGSVSVHSPAQAIVVGGTNTLSVRDGGFDLVSAEKNLTLNCPLRLAAAQNWDIRSGRQLILNGLVSGGSAFHVLDGEAVLNASNSFTSAAYVDGGRLTVSDPWALGTTANGAIVAGGAQLLVTGGGAYAEALRLSGQGLSSDGALRVGGSQRVVWDGDVRAETNCRVKLDGSCSLRFNGAVTGNAVTLTLAGDSGSTGFLSGPVELAGGWIEKLGSGTWNLDADQDLGGTHLSARGGGALVIRDATVQVSTWCHAGRSEGDAGLLRITSTGALICTHDFNVSDASGATGTLEVSSGGALVTKGFYVGKYGDGDGTVKQTGGTVSNAASPSEWRIGGGSSTNDRLAVGRYNLSGGIFQTAANLQIGAYGTGTWVQTGGSAVISGWPSVGRFATGVGTLTVSNGTFQQTGSSRMLHVGEQGTGTLHVASAGTVDLAGGLRIGAGSSSKGTVNLSGGRLTTPVILSTGGTSALNFNGGILEAVASHTNFIQGLDAAVVQSGGARIDTAGFTVRVAQALSGTGALTKIGAGLLALAASNTYAGGTVVSAGVLRADLAHATGTGAVTIATNGTLAGTGTVAGAVTVRGTIAPGASIGALATGYQTWPGGGSYRWEINRAGPSPVHDTLTISGALSVTATPSNRFIIRPVTLNSQTPGPMAGFTNRAPYRWILATATGGVTGFATNDFAVDTSAFSNAIAGGRFEVAQESNTVVLAYVPPAPPVPENISATATGRVISGVGVPGLTYWLDAATNIVAPVIWMPMASGVAATNGWFQMTDPDLQGSPERFYRIRETQP